MKEGMPKGDLRQEADRLSRAGIHQRIVAYVNRPSQRGFNWLANEGYIEKHNNAAPQYLPDPKRNERGYLATDDGGNISHDHVLQYEVCATDVRQKEEIPHGKTNDDSLKFYIHYHYSENVYENLQSIYKKFLPKINEAKKLNTKGGVVKNGRNKLNDVDTSNLSSETKNAINQLVENFENIRKNPLKAGHFLVQGRHILNKIATEIPDVKTNLEQIFVSIEEVIEPLLEVLKKETEELEKFHTCDFKKEGEELIGRGNHSSISKSEYQRRDDYQIYRRYTSKSNFEILHASIHTPQRFILEYHPERRERAEEAPQ